MLNITSAVVPLSLLASQYAFKPTKGKAVAVFLIWALWSILIILMTGLSFSPAVTLHQSFIHMCIKAAILSGGFFLLARSKYSAVFQQSKDTPDKVWPVLKVVIFVTGAAAIVTPFLFVVFYDLGGDISNTDELTQQS